MYQYNSCISPTIFLLVTLSSVSEPLTIFYFTTMNIGSSPLVPSPPSRCASPKRPNISIRHFTAPFLPPLLFLPLAKHLPRLFLTSDPVKSTPPTPVLWLNSFHFSLAITNPHAYPPTHPLHSSRSILTLKSSHSTPRSRLDCLSTTPAWGPLWTQRFSDDIVAVIKRGLKGDTGTRALWTLDGYTSRTVARRIPCLQGYYTDTRSSRIQDKYTGSVRWHWYRPTLRHWLNRHLTNSLPAWILKKKQGLQKN